MPKDLHHSIQPIHAIASQSLGATGSGGKVSKIVDRAGFESLEFVLNFGTITATGATVVVDVKDGDATGVLSSVTAAFLLGTKAGAGIGATSARASGVSKNVAKSIGYIGQRRYVQLTMAPTASGGIIAGCTALLGHPRNGPTVAAG